MSPRLRCHLLATLIALAPATHAWNDGPVDSLAWAVADSDVIVRGVATRIATTQPATSTLSTISLKVNQTLKGDHAQTLTFVAQTSYTHDWKKDERLYFLVKTSRYLQTFTPTPGELAVFSAVPLALRPTMNANYQRLPPILNDSITFLDLDLRPIKGREAVMRGITEEVRDWSGRARGSVQLLLLSTDPNVPPVVAPDELVNPAVLNVPADERALERARQWIAWSEPHYRWNAIQILSHFRSDENASLLKTALHDPLITDRIWPWRGIHATTRDDPFVEFFATWMADPKLREMTIPTGHGKWAGTPYPVRQEAWVVLNRWKRAPGDAVIRRPAYPPRYLSTAKLLAVWALCVVVIVSPFIWRSWRLRNDPAPRLFSGIPGFLLVLSAACVLLWVRSHYRIDDLTARTPGGARWELASISGKVRVLWMQNWPEPFPTAFLSVPNDAKTQSDWSIDAAIKAAPRSPVATTMPVPARVQFAGLDFRRDTFPVRSWNQTTLRGLTVPIWSIVLLLAIAPAVRVMRVARHRRRVRRGLCPACGYDLRHTPRRCPECGRMPHASPAVFDLPKPHPDPVS